MTEEYLRLQNVCNFRTGEMLLITRSATEYEMGWENTWNSNMDRSVGCKLKVIALGGEQGVYMEDSYYYPWFILRREIIKIPYYIKVGAVFHKDFKKFLIITNISDNICEGREHLLGDSNHHTVYKSIEEIIEMFKFYEP